MANKLQSYTAALIAAGSMAVSVDEAAAANRNADDVGRVEDTVRDPNLHRTTIEAKKMHGMLFDGSKPVTVDGCQVYVTNTIRNGIQKAHMTDETPRDSLSRSTRELWRTEGQADVVDYEFTFDSSEIRRAWADVVHPDVDVWTIDFDGCSDPNKGSTPVEPPETNDYGPSTDCVSDCRNDDDHPEDAENDTGGGGTLPGGGGDNNPPGPNSDAGAGSGGGSLPGMNP